MSKGIVFITGASAGFGKETAIKFSAAGYSVILCARRSEKLEILKMELEGKGGSALVLTLDVRNKESVFSAIASLPESWKNIDILVNNAGLASGLAPIDKGDTDDWDKMIDTNVKGLLYLTRAVSPGMIERGGGHIINVGSIAGKEVYPNGNVYCGTKHAVDAITRATRIDLVQYGIRVSGICPGLAETEFSIVRFKGDKEKAGMVYKGLKPLSAEDIAETIFWVATRPAHLNILDVVLTPSAQANSTLVIRKN
jgi:3-hydroxy acid dehydrogenase / malonic semialdehyde reductase